MLFMSWKKDKSCICKRYFHASRKGAHIPCLPLRLIHLSLCACSFVCMCVGCVLCVCVCSHVGSMCMKLHMYTSSCGGLWLSISFSWALCLIYWSRVVDLIRECTNIASLASQFSSEIPCLWTLILPDIHISSEDLNPGSHLQGKLTPPQPLFSLTVFH